MLLLQEIGAGACLADDMGLGKTLQAVSTIVHFIDRYPVSKNIVVCPASLIYNWKQEFEKFAPGINAVIYHGSRQAGRNVDRFRKPDHYNNL